MYFHQKDPMYLNDYMQPNWIAHLLWNTGAILILKYQKGQGRTVECVIFHVKPSQTHQEWWHLMTWCCSKAGCKGVCEVRRFGEEAGRAGRPETNMSQHRQIPWFRPRNTKVKCETTGLWPWQDHGCKVVSCMTRSFSQGVRFFSCLACVTCLRKRK